MNSMRVHAVVDRMVRADEAEDNKPITQGTLTALLAKLVKEDMPAIAKSAVSAEMTETNALLKKLTETKPDVKPDVKSDVKPEPTDETPHQKAARLQNERAMADLQKTVTDMQATTKAAQERAIKLETDSAVRAALDSFNFVKPESKEAAFRLVSLDVTRNDKGELLAGGLPLTDYVKQELTTKHDYLLAGPEGSAGAGAGRTAGTRGGAPSIQLEDIQPGMTDAQTAQAGAAILAAMK